MGGAQGWTGTGTAWSSVSGDCAAVGAPCLHNTTGGTVTYVSPTLLAGTGITGITVTFKGAGGAVTGSLTYGGTSHAMASATCDTATPANCSVSSSGSAFPASNVSYTVTLTQGVVNPAAVGSVVVNEVGATAPAATAVPCSGNCINYPTIDLPTVSTQMSSFFAYLAPLLYVVGGIGLGGLIIGKARGMF